MHPFAKSVSEYNHGTFLFFLPPSLHIFSRAPFHPEPLGLSVGESVCLSGDSDSHVSREIPRHLLLHDIMPLFVTQFSLLFTSSLLIALPLIHPRIYSMMTHPLIPLTQTLIYSFVHSKYAYSHDFLAFAANGWWLFQAAAKHAFLVF
jgi:hypothetical protein